MPLTSVVKFETGLPNLGTIPREEVPAKILAMIKEARSEIGKFDPSFSVLDLKEVIRIIDAGNYDITGTVQTRIDLSEAKGKIQTYRDNSEGGCQSCTEFMRHVLNDDMDSFCYCNTHEHRERTPKECRYGRGFSPKVKVHYHTPCSPEHWKPRFSPKLEKLIEEKE